MHGYFINFCDWIHLCVLYMTFTLNMEFSFNVILLLTWGDTVSQVWCVRGKFQWGFFVAGDSRCWHFVCSVGLRQTRLSFLFVFQLLHLETIAPVLAASLPHLSVVAQALSSFQFTCTKLMYRLKLYMQVQLVKQGLFSQLWVDVVRTETAHTSSAG